MSTGPLFGYAGETRPRAGRATIVRDGGDHERWTDGFMPSNADAGVVEETPAAKRPLLVLIGLTLLIMAVLMTKLFSLQINQGERNLGLANGNRIRGKVLRAPRGVIYDRNGGVLVRNTANFDLTVVPSMLPKDRPARDALYTKVAAMLGRTPEEIAAAPEKVLANLKNASGWAAPQLVLSGLARDQALVLDQGSLDMPGFSLDVNPVREYLDGGVLSAFLGYTGRISPEEYTAHPDAYLPTDYIGKLGLEKQYESTLRGENGSEQTEVDAAGHPIRLLASKPAVPGNSVVLTIDRGLQAKLAESLQKQLAASGSHKGSAIALDPRNGDVLAAVSLPSYDNNLFSRGISQADYQRLVNDPGQPLFNKATMGGYPSGSIIKPLIGSAALQEGVITPSTTVEDKGSLQVKNPYNPDITYTFNGWEKGGLGVVSIYRAIAMSSDIFFYVVGGGYANINGLGVNRLASYYQKFGLGTKTGVDLPEESSGRVPTPDWKQRIIKEPWYTGDTYNISVGQGDILVSPLQMATAIAAVANGGTLYKPHFLKDIVDEQGQIQKVAASEVVRRGFISAANLTVVREAMRQTVTSGTACCIMEQQVPVHVAGKTGTAETDPGGNRKPHAWFEAFAPYEDPKIVVVAMVENSGEGAEYAVPAVRETLAWYFSQPRN